MARGIMIVGCGSGAGKSIVSCGIGRWMAARGWRAAPFKGIAVLDANDLHEMDLDKNRNGMLRLSQAFGVTADDAMNPIRIIRTSRDSGELYVRNKHRGRVELLGDDTLHASTLGPERSEIIKSEIRRSLEFLAKRYDCIVIEGAGSPTDDPHDIANQFVADCCEYPTLLCARATTDSVLATLHGTLCLLPNSQRQRIVGVVLNSVASPPSCGQQRLLENCREQLGLNVSCTIPPLDFLGTFEERWQFLSEVLDQSLQRIFL